jgi:hypothetical protein
MLIPLTSTQGRRVFGLSANLIWCVEQDAQNPLITKVVTTMSNGKNMIGYEVWETPEQVIALIAQAANRPAPRLPSPESVVGLGSVIASNEEKAS